MRKTYEYFYYTLFRHKKLFLFSDLTLFFSGAYLLLKKFSSVSISAWLKSNALHSTGISIYEYTVGVIVAIAILVKALKIIFDQFPPIKYTNVEPDSISECLSVINVEITKHIQNLNQSEAPEIRRLHEQHAFDINIRLIVDAMSEHLLKTIQHENIDKKKDIFISLYSFNEDEKTLKYELHHNPKRDLIASKEIDLTLDKYLEYASTKCLQSTATTAYAFRQSEYCKGHENRHRTVKQYMGCKLEGGGKVYGFLNIEFHNHEIFVDKDTMKTFMEENVFPFKLLLEYQYLKKEFFISFKEYENNWKVA